MIKDKTAIQFFKEIEKEKDKYKLINNGFIVKYIDDEISFYVGDFLKAKSWGNDTKTNLIQMNRNTKFKQYFHKRLGLTMTGLKVWKPLNIKFIETPIEDILK